MHVDNNGKDNKELTELLLDGGSHLGVHEIRVYLEVTVHEHDSESGGNKLKLHLELETNAGFHGWCAIFVPFYRPQPSRSSSDKRC